MNEAKTRLEQIRKSIKAENISYGEIAELQGLVDYIDAGDVELLEWAGVPEHPTKFKVGFWYTVYGTAFIDATTADEAEQKVQDTLAEVGIDDLEHKVNDRDYGAQDAEAM